jgi:hypothetical protein
MENEPSVPQPDFCMCAWQHQASGIKIKSFEYAAYDISGPAAGIISLRVKQLHFSLRHPKSDVLIPDTLKSSLNTSQHQQLQSLIPRRPKSQQLFLRLLFSGGHCPSCRSEA